MHWEMRLQAFGAILAGKKGFGFGLDLGKRARSILSNFSQLQKLLKRRKDITGTPKSKWRPGELCPDVFIGYVKMKNP
jgi:hypothetical protein